MSKLTAIYHSLTGAADPLPDPHAAIAHAIAVQQGQIGGDLANAAADAVGGMEGAIQAAVHAYITAHLGPLAAPLADGLARSGTHAILTGVESYLHGLAAK